jgi:cellulose synthase/poly-beta-1,6-N-acetylglucosamine synthase-like glycosyltransferase
LITGVGTPRVIRNDWGTVAVPEIGSWTPAMTVSVIIPSFGNQHLLDLTLAGLAGQTYPSELIEVIVVDDGSEPALRLPERRPANCRLLRIPCRPRQAGVATTLGSTAWSAAPARLSCGSTPTL